MPEDVPQTVFSKIVAGEIPCRRVHENEQVLAFLDVGPLAAGHVLLIPKTPYASLEDMPETLAAALGSALPKLVRAVRVATGASGVNVLQNNGQVAGQEVMHVHFHIIPRTEGDGLGFRWNPTEYAPGQAEAVQQAIADALAE